MPALPPPAFRRVGRHTRCVKRKRHVLRRTEGVWVCSGGPREPGKLGCDFRTQDFAKAVNHATENQSTPPDMPRDLWVTA
jgi:hypothetical protein